MHLRYKHLAGLYLLSFTSGGIAAEVLIKAFFEHQCDALAHHPDGIDGVDQRLGAGLQQISLSECNHQKYHPVLA